MGLNYLSIPKLQRYGYTVKVWEWISNFIPQFRSPRWHDVHESESVDLICPDAGHYGVCIEWLPVGFGGKRSIFIQMSLGYKAVRVFPFIGIVMQCPDVGHNPRAFGQGIPSWRTLHVWHNFATAEIYIYTEYPQKQSFSKRTRFLWLKSLPMDMVYTQYSTDKILMQWDSTRIICTYKNWDSNRIRSRMKST